MSKTSERISNELCKSSSRRIEPRLLTSHIDTLDDESLLELHRLLRDLDHEKQMAVQQARFQPWRR